MNQMMGAASTALSDFLGHPVNISTPQSFALDDMDKFKKEHFAAEGDTLVVVRFMLSIEDILKSEFVNVMSVDLARELLAGFEMNFGSVSSEEDSAAKAAPAKAEPQPAPAPQPQPQSAPQPAAPSAAQSGPGPVMSQEEIEQMLNHLIDQPQEQQTPPPAPQAPVQRPAAPQAPVQPAPVQQASVQAAPAWQAPEPKRINAAPLPLPTLDVEERIGKEQADNLELIMSVPLEISVEIGRTRRKVEDILSFSKGSLVVLDKLAGDQVDLFVNGLCVARGDVVVIDDNFGVRITEVLKPSELLKLT